MKTSAMSMLRMLLCGLVFHAAAAVADTLAGTVVGVTNGDPLTVLDAEHHQRRIRLRSSQLERVCNGKVVRTCGIVTLRQQPETAKGTTFVSLEDEEGEVQVIVWKSVRQEQERELLKSRLLAVEGTWQSRDWVNALVAKKLRDLTPMLGRLAETTRSRDFR